MANLFYLRCTIDLSKEKVIKGIKHDGVRHYSLSNTTPRRYGRCVKKWHLYV